MTLLDTIINEPKVFQLQGSMHVYNLFSSNIIWQCCKSVFYGSDNMFFSAVLMCWSGPSLKAFLSGRRRQWLLVKRTLSMFDSLVLTTGNSVSNKSTANLLLAWMLFCVALHRVSIQGEAKPKRADV